jgi:hypothetical protein
VDRISEGKNDEKYVPQLGSTGDVVFRVFPAVPEWQIVGRTPDRGNLGDWRGAPERFVPLGPRWVETPTDPHVKRGGPGHLKVGEPIMQWQRMHALSEPSGELVDI